MSPKRGKTTGKSTRTAGPARARGAKARRPGNPEGRPPRPQPAEPRLSELIDMNGAIALLKTTRPTFYRWLRAGKMKAMKIGRQWRFYREDIERFLKGQEPRIALPADLSPLILALKQKIEELGVRDVSPKDASDLERAASLMTVLAVAMQASDLHITSHLVPGSADVTGALRYRVDGLLHEVAPIDIRLVPALIEQWKRMAACDVREKVKPQDGRVLIRLSDFDPRKPDRQVDLRVSFVPAALGETATLRVLDPSAVCLELDRIDYAPADREKLDRALRAPWGLILVTGPTGCGKTTVLYCCINRLAGPECKVMTVEDPVEYLLPWTTQIPIRPNQGVTFPVAMRSMLRSAPNVIMVGEIRDRETLEIAHQAALTGHLVLSTLHTNDAASALKRMVDIGSDPFLVADSTKLITAQRLVRVLCPHCSADDPGAAERYAQVPELARRGGLDWDSLPKQFKRPVGCDKCSVTGFRGRTIIAEMLAVTPEIGKALRDNASLEELRKIAVSQGMTTMAADGIRRAASGQTSLEEVLRVL